MKESPIIDIMNDPVKYVNYKEIIEEYNNKEEIIEALQKVEIYKNVLLEKLKIADPKTYQLPYIFFKRKINETKEDYEKRQDEALKYVIENKLVIVKDGRRIPIRTFPKMLKPIADLIFGRVNRAIWWGPRGGGKSLSAALFIFLMIIYKKRSVLNIGGSGEQAKAVYNYTKAFWELFPGMTSNLLDGDPCLRHTRFKNGLELRCLESANQAVGKHIPNMVIDESCTGKKTVDNAIVRAMQGVMSEKDPILLLLSTFHVPTGLFADIWDRADKIGFSRYKWNIFDAMEKCNVGMENATEEDPQAFNHCRTNCPLTWIKDVYDDAGNLTEKKFVGCNGSGRTSEGWMTREEVLEAQKTSGGGNTFEVEFACERPSVGDSIYPPQYINDAIIGSLEIIKDQPLVVGIDWGMTQTALVACVEIKLKLLDNVSGQIEEVKGIGVIDSYFMSNQVETAVIEKIERWMLDYRFRDLVILADRSHNFCNANLINYGWLVHPIDFGKYKEPGIKNLSRWLCSKRLKLLRTSNNIFLGEQLKNVKRDEEGKILKSNRSDETGDHGPDALMCSILNFKFEDYIEIAEKSVDLEDLFVDKNKGE